MKRLLPLLIALSWISGLHAAEDDYASFARAYQDEQRAYVQEEVAGAQRQKTEFEAYRRELLEAFAQYKREAGKVWGRRDTVLPANNNWVEYSNDRSTRSVVDFEKGTVRVEIAVPKQTARDKGRLRASLSKQIKGTLTLPPDDRPFPEVAKTPERPAPSRQSSDAVLAGQVAGPGGQPLSPSEVDDFAKRAAAGEVQTREVKGDDGQVRTVVSVEFPLVPDHIKKRAERFHPLVTQNAQQQRLRQELVYAIMETESFFNPAARSPVPAFGLMQLVPTSGGRDAYRHLHKVDKAPTDQQLYEPDQNIALGAAFLNLLSTNYLSGIRDEEARIWCIIAAYNTGAGNVFRTFAPEKKGKARVQAALERINALSAEEVFNTLASRLPYQETRDYVKKVRGRMPKYRAL